MTFYNVLSPIYSLCIGVFLFRYCLAYYTISSISNTTSMQQLIQNVNSRVAVSPAFEQALYDNFQLQRVAKNEQLLLSHNTARKLYFIEKGTFRTFYTHQDKEISSWFYKQNQWMTAWHSFYLQQPSFEYIEALEDSVVYAIDIFQHKKLIKQFPAFANFARSLAEKQLAFLDSYFKGYMFMSAKERYDVLLAFFPDVELRVKLRYIATHLGISQETLSRIRKKR